MQQIGRKIGLAALGFACCCVVSLTGEIALGAPGPADTFPVTITVDAGQSLGNLHPIWRYFGYDECNFTYMPNGKALLGELGQLGPEQVYIRCHHLMTSGDGTPAMKWGSTGMYHEDAAGNAVYDFSIVDRIFDTYEQNHVKPYVQIGFMPKDLSTRPDLYPTGFSLDKTIDPNAGQAYPPKDFKKWGELVYQWAKHCVDRYGKDEVQQWYWEVWNEPNIGYWHGTQDQYYELYDYAVDSVRRALPTARVGGDESAGGARSLQQFLAHCVHGTNHVTGQTGAPIDFISFHAKGSPTAAPGDGHVRMGISAQLKAIDSCFAAIASFPELKGNPIVIGESDPDGMAARPVSQNAGLGYRNSPQFPAYTAACFAREFELERKYGVNLEGALTWSFEFENKPFFAGYRVLSSNGIDMPILNLFKMMGKIGGQQVSVQSSSDPGLTSEVASGVRADTADVRAIAALDKAANTLNVLVFHYYDDDVPAPAAAVDLALANLPGAGDATLTEYRIDRDHSDAYSAWKQMGSPEKPSDEQYAQLKQAGQLAVIGDGEAVHIDGGKADVKLTMPRESVELLVLKWK
jgi:xylan 1,4-beta-xylosidase